MRFCLQQQAMRRQDESILWTLTNRSSQPTWDSCSLKIKSMPPTGLPPADIAFRNLFHRPRLSHWTQLLLA